MVDGLNIGDVKLTYIGNPETEGETSMKNLIVAMQAMIQGLKGMQTSME